MIYVSDRSDVLARSMVWLGGMDSTAVRLFSELSRDARGVLDVGAFTGVYSVLAAVDGRPTDVIAFEPNPKILPLLRRNLAANGLHGSVRIVEAAVLDSPGRVKLTIPADTTAASTAPDTVGEEVEVAATTIDLTAGSVPIDLIKIDIEGAEAAALRGGNAVIGQWEPDILVELLTAQAFDEVARLMASFGYRTIHHLGTQGPREVSAFVEEPRQVDYAFLGPKSLPRLTHDDK